MAAITTYNTPVNNAKYTSGDTIPFSITTTANGNINLFCDTAADPATIIHTWSKSNVNQETLVYNKVYSVVGTYHWDVHGSYVGGNTPGVYTFSIYAVAPKAITPGPANNSTQRPLNQQLTFVRGTAVSADVWFKIGAGAWNKIASKITGLTVNPGTLPGNTICQWRVDTYNGADKLTTGDNWTFTTITPPTKATIGAPANGATEQPLATAVSWTRPAGADSCNVWFGPTGAMVKVVSATTALTYDPPGSLAASTVYQWRIDTINGAGTTTGDVWQFTTTTPPAIPATPTPATGLTGVARNQDLSWAASARATSYRVYFSTVQADVANKAAGALQVPDITALTWDTGLMGINITYYWRIVAINEAGTTDGPVWTFQTGTPVIADPVIKNYKKKLIALANSKLWYGDTAVPVAMTSLTVNPGGSYALDTTKSCAMIEAYQKIYIINDGKYFVVDFCNVKIVSQIAFNYTTNYVPERGTLLYGTGGACMLVDFVDTVNKAVYGFVTAGTFTNSQAITGNDTTGRATSFTTAASNGAVLPTIPHVYKWTPYPNRLSATGNEFGIMPVHSSILRMHRGRCVLTGDKTAPHQWYMSQQGNFYNWAYGSEDQQAPVAGTDTDIGKIGDIIRAVIPYNADNCLFGCSQTLWLMRGDPAVSASLDNLSYVVGIFSDTSWCFDDKGNLYILNPNGIYVLGAGTTAPQSLTEKIVPNFTVDFPVDEAIHQVTMEFDRQRGGILITKSSDTDNLNYWLDLKNGGFFPEVYPTAISVTASHYHDAMTASYRKLHLGCKDGYIRVFEESARDDDIISGFSAISAEMVVGPLPMSKTGSIEGIMLRLNITPAKGTTEAVYQVFVAETAEEIITAVKQALPQSRIGGTIGGVLKLTRPRARGAYFAIRFFSSGNAAQVWALDNLSGEFTSLGTVS